MNVIETKIEGLLILEPRVFGDDRGWFMESFNQKTFERLHFQKAPYAQGKLVRVVQGKAWDVAVDIRPNSKTYGKWVGVELSGENHKQFWIPEGFAHGFVALEDNTQFLYKTTNYYNKESEGAIIWNDPDLKIEWPVDEDQVNLSEKDMLAGLFKAL